MDPISFDSSANDGKKGFDGDEPLRKTSWWGSNMEEPSFCLFLPSRRIPCPLSRRWNEWSWFETRTIKPTIKPHVWKYHQISHELSNYVWNPRFWRSLFLFHRIWCFLFRFLNHTKLKPGGGSTLHRLRGSCGSFPEGQSSSWSWGGGPLWSAYCLKINIIFWANFWGAQNWANFWASFGRMVLDSFFFWMWFLRAKSTKPVTSVFLFCVTLTGEAETRKWTQRKGEKEETQRKVQRRRTTSAPLQGAAVHFRESLVGYVFFFLLSWIKVVETLTKMLKPQLDMRLKPKVDPKNLRHDWYCWWFRNPAFTSWGW